MPLPPQTPLPMGRRDGSLHLLPKPNLPSRTVLGRPLRQWHRNAGNPPNLPVSNQWSHAVGNESCRRFRSSASTATLSSLDETVVWLGTRDARPQRSSLPRPTTTRMNDNPSERQRSGIRRWRWRNAKRSPARQHGTCPVDIAASRRKAGSVAHLDRRRDGGRSRRCRVRASGERRGSWWQHRSPRRLSRNDQSLLLSDPLSPFGFHQQPPQLPAVLPRERGCPPHPGALGANCR